MIKFIKKALPIIIVALISLKIILVKAEHKP